MCHCQRLWHTYTCSHSADAHWLKVGLSVFCGVETRYLSVSFSNCKGRWLWVRIVPHWCKGDSGGCFYGNWCRMLAEVERYVVAYTSCSSLHPQFLFVKVKTGCWDNRCFVPFSLCFLFVNIAELKKDSFIKFHYFH